MLPVRGITNRHNISMTSKGKMRPTFPAAGKQIINAFCPSAKWQSCTVKTKLGEFILQQIKRTAFNERYRWAAHKSLRKLNRIGWHGFNLSKDHSQMFS